MKTSNLIGLIIGIVVAIIVVSLISWFIIKPEPLIIQGEVEVSNFKVSSKLAGRIKEMHVKEGQKVAKGDLLFVLSTPEIDAKLIQAEAARTAASAQNKKVDQGARHQEVSAAKDLWEKAQAGAELAQKSYERVKNLYEAGVVPAQKFDEASANLKAALSTASAARSQYNMAMEGARTEDKIAAEALVKQASGAVSEVESYLADAEQYSPMDAEVSTIISEQGELIGSGYPVITLLDMSNMWVTFNIKETLLPKIKIGTVMNAHVPALDKNIKIKVYYMSPQADYATWSATKTRGEFDIRTFEIKARPEVQIEDLRPGMTVVVNWDEIGK